MGNAMHLSIFLQFWADLREVAWHARDLLRMIAALCGGVAIVCAVIAARWQAAYWRGSRVVSLDSRRVSRQDERAA